MIFFFFATSSSLIPACVSSLYQFRTTVLKSETWPLSLKLACEVRQKSRVASWPSPGKRSLHPQSNQQFPYLNFIVNVILLLMHWPNALLLLFFSSKFLPALPQTWARSPKKVQACLFLQYCVNEKCAWGFLFKQNIRISELALPR